MYEIEHPSETKNIGMYEFLLKFLLTQCKHAAIGAASWAINTIREVRD